MDKTQVKAEFNILSTELSVQQMIQIFGFTGDSSGDKSNVLKNGRIRGQSYIELCTTYEDSLDIFEQYNKLLIRIKKIKGKLLNALETGKFVYHFCIVVKIENGNTPAMTLNSEFINLLHELEAEIEFDTYANPYNLEE